MKTQPQEPVIQVEDLGKRFEIGVKQKKESFLATTRRLINGNSSLRELWALRHVTFSVNRGETLGVIGPNGAGKSTLLLLLAQILGPTEGGCRVSSRTHCFFRIGSALQPRLTVLENFSLCCALLGLSRGEFRRRLPAMIEYSGLEEYLYAKYGELSTGLAARLPFAAAVHTDLDIILVEEMLLVGDRSFQAKCLNTFHDFKAQGKTLVIVSHSLPLVESLCSRTLYLNSGKMMFLGDSAEAVRMLVRDMGGPGQQEGRPAGGGASPEQVGKIVEASARRISAELGASTEERRLAVSREFFSGAGAAGSPDGKTLELIDAEVRRLGPELRKAAAEGRGEENGTAADGAAGEALIREQISRSVEAEMLKVREEMKASLREYLAAGGREREARLPAPELSSGGDSGQPDPERRLEAEQICKGLLEHKGPLSVCASVNAAFGTVLQLLIEEKKMKPGDEVILPSVVWPWVIQGLLSYGLVPVFADLDRRTYNLDPAQLPEALGPGTRAVLLTYNGSTCADVGRVAEFCGKNGLSFIEGVSSPAFGSSYDGRLVGTIGDFGICFPQNTSEPWGLALCRREDMSPSCLKVLAGGTAAGDAFPLAPAADGITRCDAMSFRPARASGSGLRGALEACGRFKGPPPEAGNGFSEYLDFFGAFTGHFTIPELPPQARMRPGFLVALLKKESPFRMRDLLAAGFPGAPSRVMIGDYARWYREGALPFRQANGLPRTAELTERGVSFPILSGAQERGKFFDGFSDWVKGHEKKQ